MFSILTFNDHFNNCPCYYRCIGIGGSPTEVEGVLKKWLDRLADAEAQKTSGKGC